MFGVPHMPLEKWGGNILTMLQAQKKAEKGGNILTMLQAPKKSKLCVVSLCTMHVTQTKDVTICAIVRHAIDLGDATRSKPYATAWTPSRYMSQSKRHRHETKV